ncbi:hypothetical protein AB0892_03690 [Streptomyces sp. NPDC005409]
MLRTALEDLADILDQRFLHTHGPLRHVLDAFTRHHGRRAGTAGQ